MTLSMRFNLVLVAVFLVGLAVTAYLSYTTLQHHARSEVVDRAGLMMEAALAMRSYTIGEIKPLLAPHMAETFLPQTVPAYAATQAFEQLRKTHVDYTYKEATLNPTNPRARVVDWEADIVETFRNHPEQREIIGTRTTPTGQSMYLARPIRIENPGCLSCHSTVEAAPPAMVALYGPANGFGWALNEVVGAQIVSVPMSVPIQQAEKAFATFMLTLTGVFAAIIIALNILLRSMVIGPVTRMAAIADDVSTGNLRAPAFDIGGKDEIARLGTSFNRMRRSLEKALKMLDD